MDLTLQNSKKYLNNKDYILVLQQIGIHEEPVNRYKIMKELHGSTYIYDIIDGFCPSEYTEGRYLFDHNKIDNKNRDIWYKRKLIQKINHIYDLDWQIPDDEVDVNHLVRFAKTGKKNIKLLIIHVGGGNAVYNEFVVTFSVSKMYEQEETAIVTIYNEGKEKKIKDNQLIVKRNKKLRKYSFHIRKHNPKNKWYLDVIMSEKAKEKETNPNVKKYWEYVKYFHILEQRNKIPANILLELRNDIDCMNIIDNKEYWEYRLNFRGFLLYLIGESNLQRSKIKDVMSNKLTLEIAPFLLSWNYLEMIGINVIGLLSKIGQEFKYQLDLKMQDDNYLLRRVTERYFAEIQCHQNFISESLEDVFESKKLGFERYADIRLKILEFKLHVLQDLRELTEKQLRGLNDSYHIYREEYEV